METIERNDSDEQPHSRDAVTYRFGEFELDLRAGALRRHGRELMLHAKSMEVLAYLLRNPGRAVTRVEILDALWPETRVATGSLTQAIWEIRRALAQQPDGDRMIKTLRGRGYRFDGQVTRTGRGHALDGRLEGGRGTDVAPSQALQDRLRMLSSETQSIVLDLAMLLARQAADTLPATGRDADRERAR